MTENHFDARHKNGFQLERVALFSDAIFAIAITLLIIEIKVPELHSNIITDQELWQGLVSTLPKFIGFFVSFFVIGLYWLAHHRMFKYVDHCTQKLLWNNLLFLLPIVVMPFSTSFLSDYYRASLRLPLAVYMITICFAGFFSFRLWKMIGNPKNQLSHQLDKTFLSYNIARALIIPAVFICGFLLSFIQPWVAYIIPPFAPVATRLIKRHYYRKYPETMKRYFS
jgi:uncharacterized membrane protein